MTDQDMRATDRPEAGAVKPAGTSALLYALLSLVATPIAWGVAYAIGQAQRTNWAVLGFFVAALSVLVAAVVGLTQRMASNRTEVVRLPMVAALAFGVPAAVLLLGAVLGAVS